MKQEEIQDMKMSNITDASSCAHVNDLVAYLYGETNETDALDFQNHLTSCATCRAELSAFADVRGGITAWRDEALHPIVALAPDVVRQRVVVQAATKRSALIALREFFTLSPLWLRGATAFAAVLFVTLLLVTALRFFERSETPVAQQTPTFRPVEAEKAPIVVKSKDEAIVSPPTSTASNKDLPAQVRQTRRVEPNIATRPKSNRNGNAPVLSNEERSQLSDLLIAANEDEESVPRLYDLLSESN
jgi:anti-sigma factor RsiW